MRPQVLLLRERLPAAPRSALVRLSAIVDMHVGAVTIQPVERLETLITSVLLRVLLSVVILSALRNRLLLDAVKVQEKFIVAHSLYVREVALRDYFLILAFFYQNLSRIFRKLLLVGLLLGVG